VETTINGAPIELDGSGDVRTTLTLPRHRRVLVTIGYRTIARVVPDGSPPVLHDPDHAALPLVFELPNLFARVAGRVVGVAPDELPLLRVAFDGENEGLARLTSLADDGSFAIDDLPLGKGALYLVRQSGPDARSAAPEILARLALELAADCNDIVLAPDPDSLPE
jgi:hypothetical protein